MIISIDIPEDVLPEAVQLALHALAQINALWYRREWDAGRDPACCAKCHGVKYRPDAPGSRMTFQSTPALFARGVGSCGSIAATHMGHKIAEIARQDGLPLEQAAANIYPLLRQQRHPSGHEYYHALCFELGETIDATDGMVRA